MIKSQNRRQQMYSKLYSTLSERIKKRPQLSHVRVFVGRFFEVPQEQSIQFFSRIKKLFKGELTLQKFNQVLSHVAMIKPGFIPEFDMDCQLNKLPIISTKKHRKPSEETQEEQLLDQPDLTAELDMGATFYTERSLQETVLYKLRKYSTDAVEEQDEQLEEESNNDGSIVFQVIQQGE